MNFLVAYLGPYCFDEWLNVVIPIPPVHPCERRDAHSFQTLTYAQVVPPADLFLMRIVWPRIVRCPDDDFLDVDKAGCLQHLTSVVLISDGTRNSLCGIGQVIVPLRYRAILGKCVVVALGLEVDLHLLNPSGSWPQMSAEF